MEQKITIENYALQVKEAMENEEATKKMVAEKVKEGKYKELHQMLVDGEIDDDDFDYVEDWFKSKYYYRGSFNDHTDYYDEDGYYHDHDPLYVYLVQDSGTFGEVEVYQEDIDMGLDADDIGYISLADIPTSDLCEQSRYWVYEQYKEGKLTTDQIWQVGYMDLGIITELVEMIEKEDYKGIKKYYGDGGYDEGANFGAACWWAHNNNLSKIEAKDGDDLFDKIMKMEG